jgi:hypothetical protein
MVVARQYSEPVILTGGSQSSGNGVVISPNDSALVNPIPLFLTVTVTTAGNIAVLFEGGASPQIFPLVVGTWKLEWRIQKLLATGSTFVGSVMAMS